MKELDFNPFTAHGVRLERRHWIILGLFTFAMFTLTPVIWKRAEKFEFEPDYRQPYSLSNDYWQYARCAQATCERCETVLVGDSVVWGQYVTREQTLSHHLNQLAGRERFGNLGLDGSHPAALEGLIENYGAAIAGKNVILHCNALWMSDERHDLQGEQEFRFNHPRLVSQFSPRIPCYKEEISARLGIVVERHVPFNSWTNHLQSAYFNQTDIPQWTLDHPYACPLTAVTLRLPPSDNTLRHEPISWTERGAKKQEFPFVELDKSLQWKAFQRSVATLQQRGNRLFVLVGPFNEHMLDAASAQKYVHVRERIADWLKSQNIPHFIPEVLPSELYADASHPLSEGYRQLARQLYEQLEKK